MSAADAATTASQALELTRWTVTSGSNVQSRGAVVIDAGNHHWRASAEGNGAVDALFNAVDAALAEVLDGRPRLVGYDVHALGQGHEAEGLVMVAVEPPVGLEGGRSGGLFQGTARSTNIVASSIEAYIEALNSMLAEPAWAGAAESAAKDRRKGPETHGRRGEIDRSAKDDTAPWFDR
ncbi:MAG TPA: alpha-isopropylmalate synthase regulatory domain-containing protein [Candidatus Limnocylindrales bacterium]|jgi:hypothetical protein